MSSVVESLSDLCRTKVGLFPDGRIGWQHQMFCAIAQAVEITDPNVEETHRRLATGSSVPWPQAGQSKIIQAPDSTLIQIVGIKAAVPGIALRVVLDGERPPKWPSQYYVGLRVGHELPFYVSKDGSHDEACLFGDRVYGRGREFDHRLREKAPNFLPLVLGAIEKL